MSDQQTQRPQTHTNFEALQWPIFRVMCPEMSDEDHEAMRTVVCGWLFGDLEVPEA